MPAAGRVIEVDIDRLPGWVERFGQRHGEVRIVLSEHGSVVVVEAADGARAEIAVPFRPLQESGSPLQRLVDRVGSSRTVGVLLVRRTGWAAGVVANGLLIAADAGGGYVQGTTKAGGWSQQRYARRRSNQAQQVWQRAADGAARVLLPHRTALDALVCGGDRSAITAVLADSRLAALETLVEPRFLAVGEPKRSVLEEVVERLCSVVITLNELA